MNLGNELNTIFKGMSILIKGSVTFFLGVVCIGGILLFVLLYNNENIIAALFGDCMCVVAIPFGIAGLFALTWLLQDLIKFTNKHET